MKVGNVVVATGANLNKLIGSIRGKGVAFQDAVHRAMISSMYAVMQEIEGDKPPNVNRFREILLNMPTSTRRKAAANWLRKVAPVNVGFAENSVQVSMLKKAAAKKHPGWQIEYAAKNPFWQVEAEERDPAPVDAVAMLKRTAETIRKAVKGESKRPLKGDVEQAERILAGLENILEA